MRHRRSILFCCFVFLFFVLFPVAHAAPRTVRVGNPQIDNFFIPHADGSYSGYGADYLDKISEYTGWEYEYVSASWSECLEMLAEGKIDLMFPAEYSTERGALYDYSDMQCGIYYVALLCKASGSPYYYNDYASFDGMRVGMVEGSYLNVGFDFFARAHGFEYVSFYYSNANQMNAALAAGKVDSIINGNYSTATNQKVLAKFNYMPAYFITTKGNNTLMNELDNALYHISLECPDFLTRLSDTYYGTASHQAQSMTREEAEYIKNCGTLTVLCDPDNYPFEWYNTETGSFEGLNIYLLNLIEQKSGLTFSYTNVGSIGHAWQEMSLGSGDILSGIYADPALAEQYALTYSDSYVNETSTFVAQQYTTLNPALPQTIAVRAALPATQNYLRLTYPNWKIVTASSVKDCLKMVDNNKADAAFVDALALQTLPLLSSYPTLNIVSTLSDAIPVHLAVRADADPLLLSVLNKAIFQLSDLELEQATMQNTIAQPGDFSLDTFVRVYPAGFAAILVGGSMLLAFICFVLYRNYTQSRQTHLLTEKNNELQEAIALAEHATRAREQYDMLYNTAICGIVQISCEPNTGGLRVLHANKEAFRLMGLRADQSGEENRERLHQLLQETDRVSLWSTVCALATVGDKCPIDLPLAWAENELLWVSGTLELIAGHGSEKVVQATFMDTTRRKLQEDKLRRQSQTDTLTGLYNKSTSEQLFCDYLERPDACCALFVIDIDNFKRINDTYGHQYGDVLLHRIGRCLATSFRSGDIIGRIGGDEFCALLRDTQNHDGICRCAEKICAAVQAIPTDGDRPPVTCSIGIACTPRHGTTYAELFACADRALYAVKRAGKGHYAILGEEPSHHN